MGFFSSLVDGIGDALGGVADAAGDIVKGAVDVVGDFARSDIGKVVSFFLPTPVSLALTATAFVDAKYIDMPEAKRAALLQREAYLKKRQMQAMAEQGISSTSLVSPMSAMQSMEQIAQQNPGVADPRILESWVRLRQTQNPSIISSAGAVAPNLFPEALPDNMQGSIDIEMEEDTEDTTEESMLNPPLSMDEQSSISLSSAVIETDEDEEEV